MSKVLALLDDDTRINIIAFIRVINSKIEVISEDNSKDITETISLLKPTILIIDIDYLGIDSSKEIFEYIRSNSNFFCWMIILSCDDSLELELYRKYHCYYFYSKKRSDLYTLNSMVMKLLSYKVVYDDSIFRRLFTYYCQGKKYSIPVESIVSAEIYYKRCKLQLIDDHEVDIGRISLAALIEQLPDNFIQCHRSYMINKFFINKVVLNNEENYIEMIDPIGEVPIGRMYKSMFKELK